jgi:GalNAc-alpha-(1->4)-GalNAc-alpha-(1->3)-diNAcBac-PP-undecaprenol alpha-1,4-N-acetyl-D-galactosaminyltransferase
VRICLVINALGCGGAERVAATLANEWTRAGHDMSLVTLAAAHPSFYPLDSRIDRRGLDVMGQSTGVLSGIVANLSRLRRLRQELDAIRPDVIVSFIDCMNVLVLIAAIGLGIPVVVSERTDPRRAPLGAAWRVLRRFTYRRAAALVVQTESVATWASGFVDPRRVGVVSNPVIESCFQVERTACGTRVRRVVALGRLSAEKGFDILIEAFHRLSTAHPEWSLVIAGEGPLAGALREQARRTSCAKRITFAGLIENPEVLLADSEIFALSSHWEGFPNALVEAMACGCCVVATDCRSGPAEIVSNGFDGVLVPVASVESVARSLDALMGNGAERTRLGAAASISSMRFRAKGIADEWIHLLSLVSNGDRVSARVAAGTRQFASGR